LNSTTGEAAVLSSAVRVAVPEIQKITPSPYSSNFTDHRLCSVNFTHCFFLAQIFQQIVKAPFQQSLTTSTTTLAPRFQLCL